MIWAQKFICGWLIFCVGGLAPLTFSTSLSPHRDVPPVYIALFSPPRHFSADAAQTGPLAASLRWAWQTHGFTTDSEFYSFESFVPSLIQSFQSNIGQAYLLAAQAHLVFPALLYGLIALYVLSGRSALLPPIEKPPQALQA